MFIVGVDWGSYEADPVGAAGTQIQLATSFLDCFQRCRISATCKGMDFIPVDPAIPGSIPQCWHYPEFTECQVDKGLPIIPVSLAGAVHLRQQCAGKLYYTFTEGSRKHGCNCLFKTTWPESGPNKVQLHSCSTQL